MIYNKLVRDKIPAIIENKGDACRTRILNDDEFLKALNAKLNEEVAEYQESHSMEELADVLEVMMAIVNASGYRWEDVLTLRQKKLEERGGFNDKIFLEETQDNRWIYETGREETNILGSGSNLYNVFKAYDADKVFEHQEMNKGNYIRRYHKIDGRVEDIQYWNKFTQRWID